MAQVNDLSRSLASFEQSGTLVVVLEMSQSSWLAAGVVPGVERRPLKKISPDPATLLHLLERWRDHRPLPGLFWLLRLDGMVSGWRDGCALVASKPMSFIRRALQYRVSIAGRRRIVSTPRCSSASSWGGYVGSLGIARWWPSRPLRRRTPSVRAVSEKAWLVNVPGSSTA